MARHLQIKLAQVAGFEPAQTWSTVLETAYLTK
jgi:hypothetical protein